MTSHLQGDSLPGCKGRVQALTIHMWRRVHPLTRFHVLAQTKLDNADYTSSGCSGVEHATEPLEPVDCFEQVVTRYVQIL